MERVKIRRRRAVAAALVVALAAAVGLNVALGDGTETDAPTAPDAGDLSARRLAGERLVAGFKGHRPPKAVRRMIHDGELAGVILFSRNFDSRSGAGRLVRRLQAIGRPASVPDPLLVMIDQEGGEVKRLPGPPSASAAEMGNRGGSFSRRQGNRTARSLRGVGINVDLAPVLDVGRPGGAIRAEGRSFGGTAARVSDTAVPFARGLQAGGIAATGKHFPGLGAAGVNTDFGVERIGLSKATLRRVDEAPYESFIAAGGDLVMLSTAIYPAFSERPAAFARPIANGELRDRLDFGGVSVTDSLQSAAVQAFGGPAKAGRAGAAAGADILLFADYQAAARAARALRKGLRSGALPRPEFERSAQRVLDLRAGL